MASKEKFSGVAAGLFFAGAALAGIYYFQPEVLSYQKEQVIIEQDQVETAREILQKNGFAIMPEDDFEQMTMDNNHLQTEKQTLIIRVSDLEESIKEINEENIAIKNEFEEELAQLVNQKSKEELETQQEQKEQTGESTQYKTLSVKPGMNSIQISHKLEDLNIIEDQSSFEKMIYDNNLDQSIQVGEYRLNNAMSFEEIIAIITS